MQILYDWIRSIVVFILFATIIDLLLPRSSFQKYVKMVISLILLLLLISPIFKLLKLDVEETIANFNYNQAVQVNSMENSIEMKKSEIEKEQHAYTLKQMEVLLIDRVEDDLKGEYNTKISSVEIKMKENGKYSLSSEDIEFITVQVKGIKDESAVEPIESVTIDLSQFTTKKDKSDNSNALVQNITDLLAKEWELEKEKIHITYEEVS